MDLIVTAVLPIFALILAGYVCARRNVLGRGATDTLNRFVVWLALPALLFQVLAQAHLQQLADWRFVAAFGGGMMGTFALAFAARHRAGFRMADRSIEGLDGAYANTGFLGIPLALAVFGPAAVPPAVMATLLTVCVMFAVCIVLIELDLHRGTHWGTVTRKVLLSLCRNPLLVAPMLGAAYGATGWPLPVAIVHFTTLLGAAASPAALVTIGLFLAESKGGGEWSTVARLVALKLAVQPGLTALLAFGVFTMPPLWSHTALLLSALPTGTGPFMLARFYERDAAATSHAILVSTVLSLLTLSGLVVLVGHL